MLTKLRDYCRREDGAVTVDWVVLTAAVVALTGVAITSLQNASGGLGNNVGEFLSDTEVD